MRARLRWDEARERFGLARCDCRRCTTVRRVVRLVVLAVAAAWVLVGLVAMLGCGGAGAELEGAVRSGAEFAALAEPVVVEAYRAEQKACLSRPSTEMQSCVDAVRAKWAPLVEAYDRFRRAWCTLDDAVGDARCKP